MKRYCILAVLLLTTAVYAQFKKVGGGQFITTNSDTSTPTSVTTNQTIWVTSITFQGLKAARTANTGTVYIGFTTGNDTQFVAVGTGERVTYTCSAGTEINLAGFYLDVATANDGVAITYQ